jgi:hypothetical protein
VSQVSSPQTNTSNSEASTLPANAAQTNTVPASAVQASTVQIRTAPESTVITAQIPPTQVNGFSFKIPDQIVQSVVATGSAVTAQLADGKELPSWLKFDPKTMEFKAQSSTNVFEISDVIRVAIQFGNEKIIVEIKADGTLDKR